MNLTQLIAHPETMNRETLYDLRSHIALHPYHQSARLLMLQNLYLLHDPTFDEELRRSAIYIGDRRNIFNLVEAAHYQHKPRKAEAPTQEKTEGDKNRTISLIDNFLNSIPADSQPFSEGEEAGSKPRRRPTPADATVDYVAYLLNAEEDEQRQDPAPTAPQMKGQELIDNFIYNEGGTFTLKDEPEYTPQTDGKSQEEKPENSENEEAEDVNEEEYFTETLAKIYIKQGRYSKALQIIQRLNLIYPNKSRTFASQIRFLEKLILNNNKIK